MLLRLPTELIQLILRSCDARTYLNLAYCSRDLFEMATTSRELVMHQLQQVPGRPDDEELTQLSTPKLAQILRAIAHEQLFGAEHFANRKLIGFGNKRLKPQACCLKIPSMHNTALLVFYDDEAVYLANVTKGNVHITRRLEFLAQRHGTIDVLYTVVNASGVWVLHRFKPFVDHSVDTMHPFVEQAIKAYPEGRVHLAFYPLKEDSNTVSLYDFPDESEYDPIALAAYGDEKFAISWQHRQRTGDHHVILYFSEVFDGDHDEDEDTEMTDDGDDEVDHGDMDCGVSSVSSVSGDGQPPQFRPDDDIDETSTEISETRPNIIRSFHQAYTLTYVDPGQSSHRSLLSYGPSTQLTFNDYGTQLLQFSRGSTLFRFFQKVHNISTTLQPLGAHANSCVAMYSPNLALSFVIDIPFYAIHRTGPETNIPGTCHWQYLAVGIATHRVEQWTVACLLTSESNPQDWHCSHEMNVQRGRRFNDWAVVAQLGGFREADTTHGSLIVASPNSTRVAMASWKTITVWALEPRVLVDRESGYYPASWTNAARLTELQPASIDVDAVCLQLKFTENENELVAVTDRGLMFLDLRPSGQGTLIVEQRDVSRES